MTAEASAARRSRAEHLGPDLRRPMVLDAALAVWTRRGYGGTTIALIAEAAGVSKPVVYDCFADKDDVLRALLRREEARLVGAAQDALHDWIDGDDLAAVTQSGFEAFFHATLEHPDSWRVVLEAQHLQDPAVAAKVVAVRDALTDQLATLLAHHLASLDRPRPPRTTRFLAQNLIALAESNAAMLLREADDPGADAWQPAELAEAVTALVLTSWV